MFNLFSLTSPRLTLALAALLIALSAPTPSQAGSKLSKSLDDCLHCRKTEKHHPKRDEDDAGDPENPPIESSGLLPRSGELRHRGRGEGTNEAKRPIGPADSKEQKEDESDSTDLSKMIITDGAVDLTETAPASESKTLDPLREVVQALEGEHDITSLGDLLVETASGGDTEAFKIVYSAYQRVEQRTQKAEVLLESQDPFQHRDKKALITNYYFGWSLPAQHTRQTIDFKTRLDTDWPLFRAWSRKAWADASSDRTRALFSAVSHPGNAETVKLLIQNGLDVGHLKSNFFNLVEIPFQYFSSLIEEAARNGDEQTVAALLDAGAEVTFVAIAHAIRSNTLPVVELLMGKVGCWRRWHPAMHNLQKLRRDPTYPFSTLRYAMEPISKLEYAMEVARDFFFRRERSTSTDDSAPFASPLPYSNFKEFVREITTKGRVESKNLESFLRYAIVLGGKPLAEQLLSEKELSEYFDKIAFYLWDQHPTAFLDRRFLPLSPELNHLESYSNMKRLHDPYRAPLQTIVSKTIRNKYRQTCQDEVLPVLSSVAALEAIVWGYLSGEGPAWTPAGAAPTWYQPRREQNTSTASLARPSITPTQGSADLAEQKQTAPTQRLVTNPASSRYGQVVEDNANDNMDETDSMNVDAHVPAPRPESTSSLSYRPSPPSSINSSLSTSTPSASSAPKAMALDSANVNSATPVVETPVPGNGNAQAHDMVIDIGFDFRDPMIFDNSNLNF